MSKQTLRDILEALYLLEEFFDGSMDKAVDWMYLKNPHLGEALPMELFMRDRGHKVLNFIKISLEENKL